MNREALDLAIYDCQTTVRMMALQVIAQDRRMAHSPHSVDTRKAERRNELQFSVVREVQ
jgi:hypothetical protein